MRGSPLIGRMRPKVEDSRLELGVPQLKWFVTLNASRRSSTFCVLESGTSLDSDRSIFQNSSLDSARSIFQNSSLDSARSIFQNAGPVRLLRMKLPNVPEAGCSKAARFR